MHPRRGVGGSGPAGYKCNPGMAGKFSICLGHHSNAAFLTSDNRFNAAFVQPIKRSEVAFPGDTKYASHTLYLELVD